MHLLNLILLPLLSVSALPTAQNHRASLAAQDIVAPFPPAAPSPEISAPTPPTAPGPNVSPPTAPTAPSPEISAPAAQTAPVAPTFAVVKQVPPAPPAPPVPTVGVSVPPAPPAPPAPTVDVSVPPASSAPPAPTVDVTAPPAPSAPPVNFMGLSHYLSLTPPRKQPTPPPAPPLRVLSAQQTDPDLLFPPRPAEGVSSSPTSVFSALLDSLSWRPSGLVLREGYDGRRSMRGHGMGGERR